jgi:hypothetical protein
MITNVIFYNSRLVHLATAGHLCTKCRDGTDLKSLICYHEFKSFLPALVLTYNAGLSFALLFFLLFLLGSQTLLKILHCCPISPCIQHCIAFHCSLAWQILHYYVLCIIIHSEIFRVSTDFDRIWITRDAFRNISSFDQFRPDLDYVL